MKINKERRDRIKIKYNRNNPFIKINDDGLKMPDRVELQ